LKFKQSPHYRTYLPSRLFARLVRDRSCACLLDVFPTAALQLLFPFSSPPRFLEVDADVLLLQKPKAKRARNGWKNGVRAFRTAFHLPLPSPGRDERRTYRSPFLSSAAVARIRPHKLLVAPLPLFFICCSAEATNRIKGAARET
jgi:hypothetical protein